LPGLDAKRSQVVESALDNAAHLVALLIGGVHPAEHAVHAVVDALGHALWIEAVMDRRVHHPEGHSVHRAGREARRHSNAEQQRAEYDGAQAAGAARFWGGFGKLPVGVRLCHVTLHSPNLFDEMKIERVCFPPTWLM